MIRRRLTINDISEIVELHLRAFNDFFLSQLGRKFLILYYSSFIKNPRGFGVGIFNEKGKLMGFTVVSAVSRGFNRKLVAGNFIPFLLFGVNLLLTKPRSLLRLIRNMSKNEGGKSDDGNYAELFSIGVDPDEQGRGVGKLLLEDSEKAAIEKGCSLISLTTDFYNNDDVVNFYKRMGYNVMNDFITYPDRRMYKMIKLLK